VRFETGDQLCRHWISHEVPRLSPDGHVNDREWFPTSAVGVASHRGDLGAAVPLCEPALMRI
jgi:hypothetical protein